MVRSQVSSRTVRSPTPGAVSGPIIDLSTENPFLDDTIRNGESRSVVVSDRYARANAFKPSDFNLLKRQQHQSATRQPGSVSADTQEDNQNSLPTVTFANLSETPKPRKRRKLEAALSKLTPFHSSQLTSVSKGTPFPRATPRMTQVTRSYTYHLWPPTTAELLTMLDANNIPNQIYQDPSYSNEEDAPEHPREYAGLLYHLKGGTGIGVLEDWAGHEVPTSHDHTVVYNSIYGWEYASAPPSVKQTRQWLMSNKLDDLDQKPKNTSQVNGPVPASYFVHSCSVQIRGPTQANRYGMKPSPPTRPSNRESGGMTALSLEVFGAPLQIILDMRLIFWKLYLVITNSRMPGWTRLLPSSTRYMTPI
jgi:DNA polymerase zeta